MTENSFPLEKNATGSGSSGSKLTHETSEDQVKFLAALLQSKIHSTFSTHSPSLNHLSSLKSYILNTDM